MIMYIMKIMNIICDRRKELGTDAERWHGDHPRGHFPDTAKQLDREQADHGWESGSVCF